MNLFRSAFDRCSRAGLHAVSEVVLCSRRSMLAFALIVTFFTMNATVAYAQYDEREYPPYTNDLLEKIFDYVIYVDIRVLDKYLNYKGSPMNPVVSMTCTFTESKYRRRREGEKPPIIGVKYKELWYHNNKSIGLYKHCDLPVKQNAMGAIIFRPDELACEHTAAVDNAMVHLILDIYIKRAILAAVLVPQMCFEAVSNDLGRYKFYLLEYTYPGGPGENMSLHLMSNPRKMERYFYYDDSASR